MGLSIGKVRAVLLGSGILLVIVVGLFLYAHFRAGLFLRKLPARLGIDIKQETNGFTYSQSSGGKTVFTIHAAKAIQHNDGKITLHDVGIILYQRNGSNGDDRADRIYGDDFDYDQNTGVASSTGDVRIDLQAPAAAFKGKPEGGIHQDLPQTAQPDPRIVHVRTHGLVFQQKLGLASSSGQVDFASGGLSGHALGAEYNSQTGIVVLQSDVHVSGLLGKPDNSRPAVLTAAHAVLDRAANQVAFTQARYTSPGQGLAADYAVVHTTPEGTPQTLEAKGHVVLTGNDPGTIFAGRMDAALNAAGKLESSHLYQGVRYAAEADGRSSRGAAADARVAFDPEGRASHVLLTGGVTGEQRAAAGTRTLSATTLDLWLAATAPGKSVLRDAKATGNAKLRQAGISLGANKRGATTSDLAGDTLLAHFDTAGGQPRLSTVDGRGHTELHQIAQDGTEETSFGDTLSATFRPVDDAPSPTPQSGASLRPSKSQAGATETQVELQTAVQRGSFTSVRKLPAKGNAAPETQRSSADQASYDAAADRVELRGKAQVTDATDALYAERVTVERASGDAQAEGNVRVTYLQVAASGAPPPLTPPEPVHVLADHATMQHDAGTALFYATAKQPARMWQGTSRVDAPVLEFVQPEQQPGQGAGKPGKRLIARGENAVTDSAVVHAILLTGPASGPKENSSAKPPGIVRVAAAEMIYSDETREVELNGKVRLDDADGVVTANHATVCLSSAEAHSSSGASPKTKPAPPKTPSGILLGGEVDHIIATGNVQVQQPGRHADGQRLVYTADDKTFLMTGTKASPPRLFDQTQGTIAGSSLRFRSGDNSVLVSGGDGSTGPQRVRTDTRVKQH